MKSSKKLFILMTLVAVLAAASIYFSSKKIRERESSKVIVIDGEGSPAGTAPLPAAPAVPVAPEPEKNTKLSEAALVAKDDALLAKSLTRLNCKEFVEYKQMREQLGAEVNKTLEKRQHPEAFAEKIDAFREKNGLPLPLGLSLKRLDHLEFVYNNCKTICHGHVNQVFTSRLVEGRDVEVLLKNGALKLFPLHDSGLEVATIDQLNNKGTPFRSWLAPMSDGPWYILGTTLYYKLDIGGLALAITSGKSTWKVVVAPRNWSELKSVESVKISGCTSDEQCLQVEKNDKTSVSHFKAPYVCSPSANHL